MILGYLCNNVYKIKDKEVDYYEWAGQKYQFDEMFELLVDLDTNDRNYSKMKAIYQDGRQPLIITIQEIYNGMHEGKWEGRHPQMPVVKGYNSYIDKNSIRKTKGIFTPKILLFLADELNELMTSDDYKSVDTVKSALGSIARLGRAAAVHLALACQRASGSTISTDLKNNIQMSCLLGGFDDGASQLMFEKDISQLAKPQIKGRGFIGSGQEIIETQTYYTQPEKDWEFDEEQILTYNNPVFVEQCKIRGKDFDKLNTGWVPQKNLDEVEELEPDPEDDDDEFDDINEEDEELLFSKPKDTDKPSLSKPKDVDLQKDKKDEKKDPPTPVKPKTESIDDLDSLFGDEDEDPFDDSSSNPPVSGEIDTPSIDIPAGIEPTISNRDKVASAIDSQVTSKPKIKLNIDPTKANAKPKIKLNIKPPQ